MSTRFPARDTSTRSDIQSTAATAAILMLCILFLSRVTSGADSPGQPVEPTSAYAAMSDLPTQKAIDRGLNWLISGIRRNGTIGADAQRGFEPDLSSTAITGLALLADGSVPSGGKHSRESRLVLHGVLQLVRSRSLEDGYQQATLVQRKIGVNADLFLATLYLTQVYFEAPHQEEEIRAAIEILVRHICRSQGPDGTWGDESWAPVLGTVLGWQSLRSASATGFQVDASSQLIGQALVRKLHEHADADTNWMFAFYKDASSLRVLHSLDQTRNSPVFDETLTRLMAQIRNDPRPFREAGGEEFLSFYLVTECMLQNPRPECQRWYPHVRDQLLQLQNSDGSWSGHHCIVDRTFCTAAVLLTLLAPHRANITSEL